MDESGNERLTPVFLGALRLSIAFVFLLPFCFKYLFKTDLKGSKSEVNKAIANLEESEDKLKRQTELFEQKVVSQESLDTAETLFKVNQ